MTSNIKKITNLWNRPDVHYRTEPIDDTKLLEIQLDSKTDYYIVKVEDFTEFCEEFNSAQSSFMFMVETSDKEPHELEALFHQWIKDKEKKK